MYNMTLNHQHCVSGDLRALLAKVGLPHAGHWLAELCANSVGKWTVTSCCFFDIPSQIFLKRTLAPGKVGNGRRLIPGGRDAIAFAPVAYLTVGEFRRVYSISAPWIACSDAVGKCVSNIRIRPPGLCRDRRPARLADLGDRPATGLTSRFGRKPEGAAVPPSLQIYSPSPNPRSRPMKHCRFTIMAIAALAGGIAPAAAQEKPASIIVNTSGGENGPMLREAYFNDFEAATGVKILESSPADLGRLRAMVESGNVEYTVTEVESEDAGRAIELGLLEPIDDTIVDRSKFPPETLNPYLYPISSYSTIIGYSTEAFPEGGPTNWAEFWDVERFPGLRAMRNHPIDNLEAALLADGVAPADLYPLDLDRAFAKLDEIYPHVATWWTTGAQQAQLLIDGEVVATTGWNSRLFAAVRNGAPIKMEYGGGILKAAAYAILKSAPNAEYGQQLFAIMAKAGNQAK